MQLRSRRFSASSAASLSKEQTVQRRLFLGRMAVMHGNRSLDERAFDDLDTPDASGSPLGFAVSTLAIKTPTQTQTQTHLPDKTKDSDEERAPPGFTIAFFCKQPSPSSGANSPRPPIRRMARKTRCSPPWSGSSPRRTRYA
jgi:hypothetical protein